VNAGVVIEHYPRDGVIAAGESILVPVQLKLVDKEMELNLPFTR
jgi:hypothetical protein